MNAPELINVALQAVGPVITTLLALIAFDVLVAVAVALRTSTFDWRKFTLFYRTNVLPFGLTALGIEILAQFVSAEVLDGQVAELVRKWGGEVGTAPLFAQLIFGSVIPGLRALVKGVPKWEIMDPGLARLLDAVNASPPEPFEAPDAEGEFAPKNAEEFDVPPGAESASTGAKPEHPKISY